MPLIYLATHSRKQFVNICYGLREKRLRRVGRVKKSYLRLPFKKCYLWSPRKNSSWDFWEKTYQINFPFYFPSSPRKKYQFHGKYDHQKNAFEGSGWLFWLKFALQIQKTKFVQKTPILKHFYEKLQVVYKVRSFVI